MQGARHETADVFSRRYRSGGIRILCECNNRDADSVRWILTRHSLRGSGVGTRLSPVPLQQKQGTAGARHHAFPMECTGRRYLVGGTPAAAISADSCRRDVAGALPLFLLGRAAGPDGPGS